MQPAMRADGSAWFALTVMDNGIGMSAAVLEKLFQPFRQADASTVRKFGGTGLGLSITQRLVDMMDGQIRVKSAPGAGSEFRVDLPLLQALAQVNQVSLAVPDLTGLHVVLVSQELTCTTLAQSYLGSAGASVVVLPDLPAAQLRLAELPPNSVLLMDAVGSSSLPVVAEVVAPARVVYLVHRAQNDVAPSAACVPVGPLLYLELLRSVARASGQSGQDLADWADPVRVVKQRKAPSVQEAKRTGRLILVAEDNETNRDVMQEQLRLLGYAAEVAEDGETALRMWEKSNYALLLTDCHMPRMDGFELTAAIRQAEPPGIHLPIVAITANALQGEAQRCRDRGMDDYLCKPLQMAQLGAMLDKWLPLQVQPQTLATWDASALNALVGPNPVLYARLLDKFVVNAQKQVIAIEVAAAAQDCAGLAGVAHALKSAARAVGALALGELCESLEAAGWANDSATCHDLSQQLPEVFSLAAQHIAARDDNSSGTTTPGEPHEV
ncbi:MAG: response regulator [Comamonadaceae bacterium]|nr:response regulator [Comamonadaceae bacterium]